MATAVSPQPETSTSGAASPPPNCAICLGNCINKCFSDSCMHQFCFKCLLEWSKVKAVCPLCKQPFKSIIHNVKSNNEYDEHIIQRDIFPVNDVDFNDDEDFTGENFLRLSHHDRHADYTTTQVIPTTNRHFQFRTTFTVDPRGELAIQQLLSTHPLTSFFNDSSYDYTGPYIPRPLRRPLRRDVSSTGFRRFIYSCNLWVNAPPDVTGRYRDISPNYYRDNPAARNRLVPWLNRELNALLHENTQHVMFVVDVILTQLDRHHIRSRHFRQLLQEYLSDKTDHFIHEFYNFMKSPYDMIGYDRHVFYTQGIPPAFYIHLSDDEEGTDSDVAVVSVTPREQQTPVVIEINSDSSRDSDVIIREPTPPVVVNLVDSDNTIHAEVDSDSRPMLPLKIRLKRKRQSWDRKMRKRNDISDSDSESTESSRLSHRKHHKARRALKRMKTAVKKQEDSTDDDESILSRIRRQEIEQKRKKFKDFVRRSTVKKFETTSTSTSTSDASVDTVLKREQTSESDHIRSYTPPPTQLPSFKCETNNSCYKYKQSHSSSDTDFKPSADTDFKPEPTTDFKPIPPTESPKIEQDLDIPGPSGGARSHSEPWPNWHFRPIFYSSSDSSD